MGLPQPADRRELWRDRYESIRALHPSLPELTETPVDSPAWKELVVELLTALEQSHRNLIQRNTQLAGLRDLTDRLISTSDVRTLAVLIVQYLQKGYGFPEVVLALRETESHDMRAYWSALEGPFPHQGEIRWTAEEIEGTSLGRILGGDQPEPPEGPVEAPPSDSLPKPEYIRTGWYDHLIPLPSLRLSDKGRLGILAIRRTRHGEDGGGIQLELEGIAHSLASYVENRRLHREILRANRLREDLLRYLGHALLAADREGRILAYNAAAAAWTGVPAEEVMGRRLQDLPRPLRFLADRLRNVLELGRAHKMWEGEIAPSSGRRRPVAVSINPLLDERGTPYGAVAVAADLTETKEMERRIRQLDRLAAVGRFTSAIAHEIKNPLAGIAAGIEYLRPAFADDVPEQNDLQFIADEVQRLNRIIQDLSDSSHPRELALSEIDVPEVVQRSIQAVQSVLDERAVKIERQFPEGGLKVTADADRLQQVLVNLLKNAAEASPPNSVVSLRGLGRRDGTVELQVEDQGPGLSPEQCEQLFEPFFTTKPGGTGLGLYVCHGIIRGHGGRLEVESQPGRGSLFRVLLPAAGPRGEEST
ncbi:MAG: PAS domain-containing protein [Candidatus Eisenbacteria bacterium]|nr:PAS domain-containing protein [Candidatus Eisenbacteria bacterium]